MKCVYLIQSMSRPTQRYVGITDGVQKRLTGHNSGDSKHTAKFAPWELIVALSFSEAEKAIAFERYLKTGSGRAFAQRHFW